MKKFEAPVLEVIEDFAMEPVYALSGTPDTPDTPDKPKGDWEGKGEWRNHNSGSHSELAIIAKNNGSTSGEGIIIDCTCNQINFETITDSSGYPVSMLGPHSFRIYRNGHFNPGERIEFNIQVIDKNSPYHGSVAQTGQPCPHVVQCTVTPISN